MKHIKEYFNSCVEYWKNTGDPTSVAVCKALWWDCAETWNAGKSWDQGKYTFFNQYRKYEPYSQLPEVAAIESGNA